MLLTLLLMSWTYGRNFFSRLHTIKHRQPTITTLIQRKYQYSAAMDQLPALGKSIQNIVQPTFKIYDPLLKANAETIRSVKKETFTYGSHERPQLDVYSPPTPSRINGRHPILMFEYGGGLIQGARTLPPFDGLVHANVGAFFALKFGYTV